MKTVPIVLLHVVFIALTIAPASSVTHYTWWSISSFGLYQVTILAQTDNYFAWFFRFIQVTTVIGATVLPFMKCDLFESTLNNVGFLQYVIGNFAMHYLPALLMIGKSKNTADTFESCIWLATAVFLTWISTIGMSVYECKNAPDVIFSSVTVAAVSLASIYIRYAHLLPINITSF